MIVGISGAGGRMGRRVAEAIAADGTCDLGYLYDPYHPGVEVAGHRIADDPDGMGSCEVVVEFTQPAVVLDNLVRWRALGCHAVVGTSGFDAVRLNGVRQLWGSGPPNCLIVPNFSIGAVLMMRFAEMAAGHFAAAEIVELHHDRKVDAPSGTAIATAERIGAMTQPHRAVDSTELIEGARGAEVAGINVHSIRLPGLLAHQEVLLANPGELLTIRHDTTDLVSFIPGVLLAIRKVAGLDPVSVGLDQLL